MQENLSDRDWKGWWNALVAFGWWGFVFPLVLLWAKSEGRIEKASVVRWSLELLSLRVVFCVVFCFLLLAFLGRLQQFRQVFQSRQLLVGFLVSAFLIFLNWLGFIVGASMNNLSQASLGYYMGPLFNVVLGYFFLAEKLRRFQFAAVCIAGTGIFWLICMAGEFPWIALCLATSFGFYGLVRKKMQVDSVVGLTMETLYCLPVCLVILVLLASGRDGLVFTEGSSLLRWIVLFTGPATAIPLICFAVAAKRLRLGTLGFIQFIAPTGQLILAMVYDAKPVTGEKLIGYSFVWAAVAVYLVDLGLQRRGVSRGKKDEQASPSSSSTAELKSNNPTE
ncbi:MAG: EamA family transporter RarD [Planctomycetota bacterium]|nr:EamA family transporter RarD [Planctomycetota bacterium]